MPRWNCSPLQRFAQCVDLQSIQYPQYPELGPLLWKKKTYSGIPRKTKVNKIYTTTPTMAKLSDLEKTLLVGSNANDLEHKGAYSPAYYFPVFITDGRRYNAIRWLFFQAYHHTGTTAAFDPIEVDDPALRRRMLKQYNTTMFNDPDPAHYIPAPPKYRPWHLADDQQELIVALLTWSPWHGDVRKDNEFYYLPDRYRVVDGIDITKLKFPHLRTPMELTQVWWIDHKTSMNMEPKVKYLKDPDGQLIMGPDGGPVVDKVSPPRFSRKDLTKKFPRIPLEFPEVVGRQRLELVRHYLRGGTDDDRPFAGKYIEEEF